MSNIQIFSDFQVYLDSENALKEDVRSLVRELEQTGRQIQMVAQGIHQNATSHNVLSICEEMEPLFQIVRDKFSHLAKLIPTNQYYRSILADSALLVDLDWIDKCETEKIRFNDMWRFVVQRFVYLAALRVYLSENRLLSHEEVSLVVGVCASRETGFHLDLDDFLMGLLMMASELSRFAVNAVISGETDRPIRVSKFLAELDAGFRLLNLKNDMLRKKVDSLKYSVQKVEGVVYDLTIRSLVPSKNNCDSQFDETLVRDDGTSAPT